MEGHEALLAFLRDYSLLTEAERKLIVDHSDVRAFPRGTVLLGEGQVATKCYLVLRGCVREFIYKDGEEKSTAFYTEGEPVTAFTSSSQGTPASRNLVCVEDCLLTVSDNALEEEMCRLIPRLESIIRQEVEKTTGLMQDELSRFITSSPEERYRDLMDTRPDLLRRIPQHQIASFIGVTPESLSRIRKRMARKAE